MNGVNVFDAKNRLSALLDRVERGEEVTITRRGKAIAKLVPTASPNHAATLVQRMQAIQDRIAARGEPFTQDELRAYRDQGRR
ncbi:MAG TPA: type II toxin-antitoxin system prevent-host-death family antitoxin [Geminicoccus sp.]|jgi:prevent-host-death family protein|uniref:type II toxin-antitoxin system Phd/YefM family antitoxin n=1 Tax=Geminicoccus sp. TaxID=2024832 RepID=UPI002E3695A4|nr:type II toxin-antitoxin system prevent-host-death family antitoxin [Geminicoccus sp.]HEX2524778.1 type II toxin-antitoxin system prevent-host-death family antitoxin [Geminicoccus sp.]